jgi:hypothetical protein
VLENLACAMDVKFDKYWDNRKYNMALVIAIILDPSKKTDFLDFFYEKICSHFVDIRINLDIAKEWFTKYFEEYTKLAQRDDPSSLNVGTRTSTLGSPVLGERKLDEEFAQWSHIRGRCLPKSELDAYLDEVLVRTDERFEILSWWRTDANRYSFLSAMTRDFQAIPLSIVPSESAFSVSGCSLADNRSSMTPETLECLVCCKDWLYEYPNVQGN